MRSAMAGHLLARERLGVLGGFWGKLVSRLCTVIPGLNELHSFQSLSKHDPLWIRWEFFFFFFLWKNVWAKSQTRESENFDMM